MLPRWLTALPRFAATWRDEILVIALGFAYQAGVSGSLGAPRTHEAEHVVVRIAAEQPRTVVEARVTTEAIAVAAPTAVRHRMHVAPAIAPVAAVAPVVRVAPVPRVQVVAPVRVPAIVVTPDAGENVAADLTAGLDVTGVVIDTSTLPEIRASIARARAAMDEARVRAAIQKALAAERALQGPGA